MEERLRLSGPLKWATLSGPLPLLRPQVLVADYNEIGQSAAIERYVACRLNFLLHHHLLLLLTPPPPPNTSFS
eukprot:scaffold43267_cov63-Phaeocystis_antarctica.AAC.1